MDWGSGSDIKRKNDSNGNIKLWKPSDANFRFETNPESLEFNENKAINDELKEAKEEFDRQTLNCEGQES